MWNTLSGCTTTLSTSWNGMWSRLTPCIRNALVLQGVERWSSTKTNTNCAEAGDTQCIREVTSTRQRTEEPIRAKDAVLKRSVLRSSGSERTHTLQQIVVRKEYHTSATKSTVHFLRRHHSTTKSTSESNLVAFVLPRSLFISTRKLHSGDMILGNVQLSCTLRTLSCARSIC